MRAPRHIVVVHMGAVGDTVLALPLAGALRATWPGARLTWLAQPQRATLVRYAGLAEAVADLETDGLWRWSAGEPPPGAPPEPLASADLVVDLLSGGRLAEALAAEVVTVDPMPPEDWTESAATWLLEAAGRALPLAPVAPEPVVPVAAPAAPVDGPFVAIHPGSGSPRKNWPRERFAELAHTLRVARGLRVLWLVGPAELERGLVPPAAEGDAVLAEAPLPEVAQALAAAMLYVGNDSGLTHLAAAVRGPGGRRTPVVALVGPTDPRVWAPRGPHVRIVRAPKGRMDGLTLPAARAALAPALPS